MVMRNNTMAELRRFFDGDDPFMESPQIIKRRHPERRYESPVWTQDNKQVLAFLLRRFPKWNLDGRQQRSAQIWGTIIVRYFQERATVPDIGSGLRQNREVSASRYGFRGDHKVVVMPGYTISNDYIKRIIQQVRFLDAGLRTDGRPHTGRNVGRPKKTNSKPTVK
jgi:hypothetical protein